MKIRRIDDDILTAIVEQSARELSKQPTISCLFWEPTVRVQQSAHQLSFAMERCPGLESGKPAGRRFQPNAESASSRLVCLT